MFYHKTGYPEENELVFCTVTNVQYNSVFCNLDFYGKTGMIHISEVSPGRIRNIRDYVVEGKKVVCKVLRIHEERGHIDLSLRRVTDNQRREVNALVKQEQKAEKIIENMATELKKDPKELYATIAGQILENYEYVHMAFQEHVDGDTDLSKLKISKDLMQPLLERIVEKIKPKSVTIGGTLTLATYADDGINVIKEALIAAEKAGEGITVRYLGSGKYRLEVVAEEYKDAEKVLDKAVAAATAPVEKSGVVRFER